MDRKKYIDHANELCNKYLHLLLGLNVSQFKDFSIQDLCILFDRGNFAIENRIFEIDDKQKKLYMQKLTEIKYLLISKIKEAPVLYYIIDETTKNILIDEKFGTFIFSEKEYAEDFCEHFKKSFKKYKVRENLKKDRTDLFSEIFFAIGIDGFLIDNGLSHIFVQKESLQKEPIFSKFDKIVNPIFNPKLEKAILLFLQELRWQVNYKDRQENVKRLEIEYIKAIKDAKFLVPVKVSDVKNIEKNKKSVSLSIPSVSSDKGVSAVPIFTDWVEFSKVYNPGEFHAIIWNFKDLKSAPDNTIALNLGSYTLTLTKESLQKIEEFHLE